MTALARVDWPAVFGRLLDEGDEELRERALWYAGLRSPISPPVAAFASVVCGTPFRVVCRALGDDLDADMVLMVAAWLREMAHVTVSVAGHLGDPRPPGEPATPGLLLVDPDLEWLPLLDLATDVARTGALAVEVGSLRPGVAGIFDSATRRITLDRANGLDERVWSHELSHALDPMLGRRQAPELDELFADELGRLLLGERPATVLAAVPLIERCCARIPDATASPEAVPDPEGLPDPGACSILAFFNLPVIVKG